MLDSKQIVGDGTPQLAITVSPSKEAHVHYIRIENSLGTSEQVTIVSGTTTQTVDVGANFKGSKDFKVNVLTGQTLTVTAPIGVKVILNYAVIDLDVAGSETLAQRWANEAEDILVAEGEYSAKHYAAKAAAFSANDFTATSATSTLIGTGSKVFAIQTGKAFVVGQVVRIVSAANTANYMTGQIAAASDGSITVNVVSTGGSGTFADWSISLYQLGTGQTDIFGGLNIAGVEVFSSSNVLTIDCQVADNFTHTMTENTTVALSNVPSDGLVRVITLDIIQDSGASGFTIAWPAGSLYEGATAPSLSTTASARDIVQLRLIGSTIVEVVKARNGFAVV